MADANNIQNDSQGAEFMNDLAQPVDSEERPLQQPEADDFEINEDLNLVLEEDVQQPHKVDDDSNGQKE